MATATVPSQGQITIPKPIREALELEPPIRRPASKTRTATGHGSLSIRTAENVREAP